MSWLIGLARLRQLKRDRLSIRFGCSHDADDRSASNILASLKLNVIGRRGAVQRQRKILHEVLILRDCDLARSTAIVIAQHANVVEPWEQMLNLVIAFLIGDRGRFQLGVDHPVKVTKWPTVEVILVCIRIDVGNVI